MRNAKIIASTMAVPGHVIPNSYFDELLGEDVSTWLVENLTIRERRWLNENESVADLCVGAAQKALVQSDLNANQIDLIIVATDTPEFISPSTASVVQDRLKAKKSGTFDLNTACAGFVTAIDVGSKYIRSDDQYNNVLVIGAYGMSKYLDLQDKKTVTLFADGAGAVILKAVESEQDTSGFLGSKLYTEGQYNGWMGIYAGGTRHPLNKQVLDNKDHLLKFVKKFPKEINPQTWTRMISELSMRNGHTPQDIDKIFFTQININSIVETMANLGLDMSKTHTIMDRFAYTGSACIPMALADASEKGMLKSGDLVYFMGSGGGLAFACAGFRW
ncbi:MAG: ketoacyl-ACP synthase III [Calditrichae bacterium]|nr:ketoacyl-ACP synthase III [Calditrichota bacterium]MCB9059721.1 ketoacyl-ACP synthase III [Calditrichia bacterium]